MSLCYGVSLTIRNTVIHEAITPTRAYVEEAKTAAITCTEAMMNVNSVFTNCQYSQSSTNVERSWNDERDSIMYVLIIIWNLVPILSSFDIYDCIHL